VIEVHRNDVHNPFPLIQLHPRLVISSPECVYRQLAPLDLQRMCLVQVSLETRGVLNRLELCYPKVIGIKRPVGVLNPQSCKDILSERRRSEGVSLMLTQSG
jgi:hypothetical protein